MFGHRLTFVIVLGLAACQPMSKPVRTAIAPPPASAPPKVAPPPLAPVAPVVSPNAVSTVDKRSGCGSHLRRLSGKGVMAANPALVANQTHLAVAWQEHDGDYAAIRLLVLDSRAKPLGPSVQLAEVAVAAPTPLVIADGDGYAVLWRGDGSILLRRADRLGRPSGDAMSLWSGKRLRLLAALRSGEQFRVVLAGEDSAPQALSFSLDGKLQGKPRSIKLAKDAELALLAKGKQAELFAWDGDAHHVRIESLDDSSAAAVSFRFDDALQALPNLLTMNQVPSLYMASPATPPAVCRYLVGESALACQSLHEAEPAPTNGHVAAPPEDLSRAAKTLALQEPGTVVATVYPSGDAVFAATLLCPSK